MATITATQIKNENKWTDANISDTNLGYLIDNVIDYINLMAGTSISNLAAGTVTVTSAQAPVIKAGVALAMRAYLDKGPQVATQGQSLMMVVNDPHYKFMSMVFKNGINMLRGRSLERA